MLAIDSAFKSFLFRVIVFLPQVPGWRYHLGHFIVIRHHYRKGPDKLNKAKDGLVVYSVSIAEVCGKSGQTKKNSQALLAQNIYREVLPSTVYHRNIAIILSSNRSIVTKCGVYSLERR